MSHIAIAAEAQYTTDGKEGPWRDDLLLQQELTKRGHQARIINWEHQNEQWVDFDSIFVSSTWNACNYPNRFLAWLDTCERDGRKRLINDHAVLRVGFFKNLYWYLLQQIVQKNLKLQKLGQLTPSRCYTSDSNHVDKGIERFANRRLADLLAELDNDPQWGRSNVILKPVVSADGKDTFVYNRFQRDIPIDTEKRTKYVLETHQKAEEKFQQIVHNTEGKGLLIQPYMEGVEAGEYSLTFIGDSCTHAVQKPKLFKGDGSGRRQVCALNELPHNMLRFAEELVKEFSLHFDPGAISRMRVDLFDQYGTPVLCEVECVEPNMNINVVERHNQEMMNEIIQKYADMIEQRTTTLIEESESSKI